MLGGFELGDVVLDFYHMDKQIVECRSDEDFMLYDRHEFRVELVMRHVKLLCWECLCGLRKYLGLTL